MHKPTGTSGGGKVALVTGASGGIGLATATALVEKGYIVFGTSRRAGMGEIVDGVRMIPCDVTSDASVAAAVFDVEAAFGRIDLLVNNAGAGLFGAAEESSIEQVQRLFDTNVYGTMRMTHAVLPVMRRQGSGRIVNISSMHGIIPAPFSAHYSAAKHAIEGYSESLDHEVRGFGIRVVLVEPGLTPSSFAQNSAQADRPIAAYAVGRASTLRWISEGLTASEGPGAVSRTILQAASATQPKLRYTAGKGMGRVSLLRRFVPASAFDKTLRKQMHLT